MRSIKSVEKEIREIERENFSKQKKSYKSKQLKRLSFLRTCNMYLESNPSVDFINQEIKRISSRIELLEKGFDVWKELPRKKVVSDRGLITFYRKEMGIPNLKIQLSTLKFILK